MMKTPSLKLFLAFLLVSVLSASVASAQITTSTISGVILDESGVPVPGVAVLAEHNLSGSQYYTVSNSYGFYTMSGMRPGGPYTLTFSILGYKDCVQKNLRFAIGENGEINAVLEEDKQMLEGAVIVEQGGLDAFKTGASQTVFRHQMNSTPSVGHGIGDMIKSNPFVKVSGDGSIAIAGANYKYNNFLIDGAGNSDVFGLTSNGFNGGLADAQPVAMETIDQIQVVVAPFDIRHSGYTGGSINAVTKSGENIWHAAAYGFGDGKWLCGPKYERLDGSVSSAVSDMYHYHAGVSVSGPIAKDKLFFYANYERRGFKQPNAYGIGSDASAVDAAQARELLSQIQSMAGEQGIGYKGSFPTGLKEFTSSDMATFKLDWNPCAQHHLTLRWGLVSAGKLNKTSTASSLVTDDFSYVYNSLTNNAVLELQSDLGRKRNVHNEFRVSYVDVRDKRNPCGEAFPMIEISNVGKGKVTFGNENSSAINRLDQKILTLTDNVSITFRRNNLVIGVQSEVYHFSNLFIRYPYGTYKYSSPDDFRSGNISEYFYGHANTEVTGDPMWAPSFMASQSSFYIQNRCDITSKFNVIAGIRADVPVFFSNPQENAGFNAYASQRGWELRTDSRMKSLPLWSPRLGFRYDMAGDGRYVLRGGSGVFTGKAPFVWFMSKYADTGIQKTSVSARNPSDISLILNPHGQQANERKLSPDGSQSITVSSPDIKMPQSLRVDLAFDLLLGGIDWTFEGLYSKKINDISYRQLSYEATGQTVGSVLPWMSYDTRPMYSKTSPDVFNDIYCMTNNSKGYSYSLVASAKKSFSFGLDLSASYTYSRTRSVFESFSTTSESNFCANLTHSDPNDPELGFSFFNVPHQVKAALTYKLILGSAINWMSTFSLVYNAYSGSAYSLYYNGDLNGDSSSYNDLIFIPTDSQVDAMHFKAAAGYPEAVQKENLKAWLSSAPYVKDHRGEYFDRYAANMPFEHHFDFHFGQKVSFYAGSTRQSFEITFDLVNLGNLFNPKWGRTYTTLLANTSAFSPITYDSKTRQFQFLRGADYNMFSCDDILSRWRGQLGLKYSF